MRKYGLKCPIRKNNPYKKMLKNIGRNNYAPNILNREFTLHGPRYILLTDITYLFYDGHKKKAYLSVIKYAYTKEILAYVLSESLQVDFILQTIKQLLKYPTKRTTYVSISTFRSRSSLYFYKIY